MGAQEKPGATPYLATALVQADGDKVKVLAHARGEEVGTMLTVARAHEIPVVQDFALSSALTRMPAGSLIPDKVYQSVAVLLDFLITSDALMEELRAQDNTEEPDSQET